MTVGLRPKDLLGPVTRVNKKKKNGLSLYCPREYATDSNVSGRYRGTSLIRNCLPLGTYSSICLGPYGGPWGGWGGLMSEVPL